MAQASKAGTGDRAIMIEIPILLLVGALHQNNTSWEYHAGLNDGAGLAWADHQDGMFLIPLPSMRECIHANDDGHCQGFVKGYLDTVYGILNGTLKK
jgi:hypothetical protein